MLNTARTGQASGRQWRQRLAVFASVLFCKQVLVNMLAAVNSLQEVPEVRLDLFEQYSASMIWISK